MNSVDREIVRAVTSGNMGRAKEAVRRKLENNKVKKDEPFVQTMLSNLDYGKQLPLNLKGLLVEELEVSLPHYYLAEGEQKLLEDVKKTSETYKKLEELGIHYPNTLLLHGESGTGKTTFAKYVAQELEKPYVYVTFSRLVDSLLGKTQKNLQDIFDYIGERDCVFVLDEIDTIALERGSTKDVGEMDRIVVTLMQCMDNLSNNTLMIGITNRYGAIDAAVKRRFKKEHAVVRLSLEERMNLAVMLNNTFKEYALSEEELLGTVQEDKTQAAIYDDIVAELIKKM